MEARYDSCVAYAFRENRTLLSMESEWEKFEDDPKKLSDAVIAFCSENGFNCYESKTDDCWAIAFGTQYDRNQTKFIFHFVRSDNGKDWFGIPGTKSSGKVYSAIVNKKITQKKAMDSSDDYATKGKLWISKQT